MHGFGSHTFSLINNGNERHWVKFHFRCEQGIENLMDDEAMKMVGMDRESFQRDLFNAIEQGDHPRWTMQIQVLTEDQAATLPYNPFDLTKVWRHGDAPLMDVGYFELNKNPDNYFNEVEQVAMNPASVVPGISFFSGTKCSRAGSFPTVTPTVIGWASTTTRYRLTPQNVLSIITTGMVPCG